MESVKISVCPGYNSPPPPPADPFCPDGYYSVAQNLDGSGKKWSQPHPDPNRSMDECAAICDSRHGCTGYEYAEGPKEHGACGTYTGGNSNIKKWSCHRCKCHKHHA